MKLDAKVQIEACSYHGNTHHGLTKLEHMSIEFMKQMITRGSTTKNLKEAALQAVTAARILAGILEAEEGR